MAFAQEAQVTKYVAQVHGPFYPLNVYLTGASPKTYLFAAMDKAGLYETGLRFPVRSRDLARDVRSALANGVNYPVIRRAPVRLAL